MMNFEDWGGHIRFIASLVVFLQLVGAAVTFTPLRERRRAGVSHLFMIGFVAVMIGAQASPLFVPAAIPGMLGLAAAVALFVWARITIRGLFFSYINSADVPGFICSRGPYRWVRHPFYTSYLSSLVATTLMFPNLVTIAGSIVAFLAFNSAAAFEESKFLSSPLAVEYAAYIQRTGRFVPRFTP